MAAYNGVNPQTAADLLRQAVAQNSARHENGARPDRIGSSSPTPTGIETPQPDPSDKRLPGIISSFFGQVGRNPSSKPKAKNSLAVTTPFWNFGLDSHHPKHGREARLSQTSSRSSGSLVMVQRDTHHHHDSPPEIVDELGQERTGDEVAEAVPTTKYPLTPISSTSSFLQKETPTAENGQPEIAASINPLAQALKNLVLSPSSIRSRRHASLPVSSVNVGPVLAAHILNPSNSSRQTAPGSPTALSAGGHDSLLTSASIRELGKLTSRAASTSRPKNTPPLTPRALSQEEGYLGKRSPLSKSSMTAKVETRPESTVDKSITPTRNNNNSNSNNNNNNNNEALPTGPPKGKLSVKIDEARGLKPSYDPYVVCVFEWNEYISNGPKHDAMDVDHQQASGKKSRKDMISALPIRRTDSDMGKPMAIPMKSRQSSNNSEMDSLQARSGSLVTDPHWDHEAMFDVLGRQSEIDISVYDRSNSEAFLGHVRLCLNLTVENPVLEGWFPLDQRGPHEEQITGEIHLRMRFQKTDKKQFGPSDFQILKLIGKGTFGQVYQVRKKDTQRIYAMKVLSKKVIIQKKEVAHTLGERNILVRTAMADSPFIVGLKFSFQTPTDLYLVTDFMSGGELFWHLQKEGRFQEGRAKFYIAELILALQHLHQHDIVYRDLKPENILLDANGHIALCDFGLSKANLTKNDTTNTFCGTTEYLAPEVLLDEQGYTKMVDFWSLGVLVFEMCCGWSPFYAEDTQQMYKNIAFGKVRFPRDALSTEGRNFVKGLLNRNPKHRLGANRDAQELIEHPFFDDIDWDGLAHKNIIPPFKPKLKSVVDTSNFDPEFTNALDTSSSLNARAVALAGGAMPASTPLSPTMQNAFKGFTFVDESSMDGHFRSPSFEGNEDQRDEDQWLKPQRTNSHRMSGIVKTGGDDGIFNNEGFDE